MFTPDFFLPELDLYIELTTMKQSLVTEKNHKVRLLRERYPDINVRLLYKKDYHKILAKFGYGPLTQSQIPGIKKVLLTTQQIQRRVASLGRQISKDYAGKEPVLVGVLRGVLCFMSDLMQHITVPVTLDFMSISHYGSNQ
ncbi:MAG: phosphoribosyltransferase family protein, partial [Dehalococcoidia bacterium]